MNYLKLELTHEQQFFLESFKRQSNKFSKEELIDLLITVQTQNFNYLNAYKSLLKDQHQ